MIEADHPRLSIQRQCALVSISRSAFYYQPAGEPPLNLELMRLIDETFLETPWYGSRQMARHLRRRGYGVGRMRVRRLMAKMGLAPIYQKPRTTIPHPEHRAYKYLLRGLTIDRPNQVWCSDITYIPMRRGLPVPGGGDGLGDPKGPVLAAVQQHGRRVLHPGPGGSPGPLRAAGDLQHRPGQPGRIQSVVATSFVGVLRRPIESAQFTSPRFVDVLRDAGVRVSMDGRGRWMDNVFIERLWRSLKYECVYIHAFETGSELRAGLTRWIGYYNTDRPHSALAGATPDEAYGLHRSANWRRDLNLNRP